MSDQKKKDQATEYIAAMDLAGKDGLHQSWSIKSGQVVKTAYLEKIGGAESALKSGLIKKKVVK